jgi:RecA-family ATPase
MDNQVQTTPVDGAVLPVFDQAVMVEQPMGLVQEPPAVKALADLRTPMYGNDPNELLKHKFLSRGGMALLCGPTGIGKSSLMLQAAIFWSVGKPFFGIVPGEVFQRKGMRVLIVQAENDEGDLAEMRNGVLAGCEEISPTDKKTAGDRIMVATVTDKSADAFAGHFGMLLSAGIEGKPYDLAFIDPVFAYLGGDGSSQKDVSRFMRELLNPLVQKHRVGVLLVHHTNKPLRGKDKDGWAAGDYAYLGSGSAEWVNAVRAALALQSIGSDTVFELRAIKRGQRLRWNDYQGERTFKQYIAYHRDEGVICWRQASAEEVADALAEGKAGRPKAHDDSVCLHAVQSQPGASQETYLELIVDRLGCGRTTAQRMFKACIASKWLIESYVAGARRYVVTPEGLKEAERHPTAIDWSPNPF